MGRLALLLTFAGTPLAADVAISGWTNEEIAQRAEREFQNGVELRGGPDKAIPHFRIASDCFEELRIRGVRNPELYRDLGNASLLAGDLPRAVLSYRRGLRLAPTDPDLLAGLTEARSRVAYGSTGGFGRSPADHRPPWLPRVGSAELFAGAVLCYVASCFYVARWLMTRRRWPLISGLVALVAAMSLMSLMIAALQSECEEREHPLVVVAEDGVLLRKGDGLAYPPRYETTLNKGAEARRLYERGDWAQIELSGGEIGWVRSDKLLVDE